MLQEIPNHPISKRIYVIALSAQSPFGYLPIPIHQRGVKSYLLSSVYFNSHSLIIASVAVIDMHMAERLYHPSYTESSTRFAPLVPVTYYSEIITVQYYCGKYLNSQYWNWFYLEINCKILYTFCFCSIQKTWEKQFSFKNPFSFWNICCSNFCWPLGSVYVLTRLDT